MRALIVLWLAIPLLALQVNAQQPPAAPAALDFEFFRTRIQPVFLKKRPDLARCYVCHSQGTPLVLEGVPPGPHTLSVEVIDERGVRQGPRLHHVTVPGPDAVVRVTVAP